MRGVANPKPSNSAGLVVGLGAAAAAVIAGLLLYRNARGEPAEGKGTKNRKAAD